VPSWSMVPSATRCRSSCVLPRPVPKDARWGRLHGPCQHPSPILPDDETTSPAQPARMTLFLCGGSVRRGSSLDWTGNGPSPCVTHVENNQDLCKFCEEEHWSGSWPSRAQSR
jgi:hypothetical protein